jgi:hypothetical protein
MEGAPLAFLPDTGTDLTIKLKLVWEWSSFTNKSIRLLSTPVGSAVVRHIKPDQLGTPEDGVVNDSHSR